jgi:hypothetical protein
MCGTAEHVKAGAHIMASCVLLGGQDFLAAHGAALAGTLAHSIDSVGEKGLLALMPVGFRILSLLGQMFSHGCVARLAAASSQPMGSATGRGLPACMRLDTAVKLWVSHGYCLGR